MTAYTGKAIGTIRKKLSQGEYEPRLPDMNYSLSELSTGISKSKWCSNCRNKNHNKCTGTRRIPHFGIAKCECPKCKEKKPLPILPPNKNNKDAYHPDDYPVKPEREKS